MDQYFKKIITPVLLYTCLTPLGAQASVPVLVGVYAGGGLGYHQDVSNSQPVSSAPLVDVPVVNDAASPIPFIPEVSEENNVPETLDAIGPVSSDAQTPDAPVMAGVYAGGGLEYPSTPGNYAKAPANFRIKSISKNTSGKNALTGWFVGGGLGWQNLSSTGATSMIQGGPSATDKTKPAGNGVVGEVHVGASRTSNWVYYGGKVFANTSSTNAKNTKHTTIDFPPLDMDNQVKISKRYGIGAVGHLGTTLGANNALYGIFGVSLGQFKIKYTETEDNASGSQSKTLLGVPLGIGYAHAMTESIRVFGEGTYTIYQSFTTKNLNPTADDSFKAKIAPREFNFIMGVSYTF